ncbi:sce7726 family protein [Undibacterium sp. SXout7W]|uniref:sce7726 family protein n=1 Tax=Undibacterium sp. SXout7W TaxID=3413049 RepID=UPI003BF2C739
MLTELVCSIREQKIKNNDLLGDKEIRHSLKIHLTKSSRAPRAVLEELRVHNGNAIADIVAIHNNNAHCYEIKSDKDSIERVQKQAQFYDLVFRKVTLVTTARHLDRAILYTPAHWGIMVAKSWKGRVICSYVRPAGVSNRFDKQLALLTLWKSELTTIAEPISESSLAKLSRKRLTELLAENFSRDWISKQISEQLLSRVLRT